MLTADEFLARDDWPQGTQLIEGEVVVNQPNFDVALELRAGDCLTSPLLDGFALDLGDFFRL